MEKYVRDSGSTSAVGLISRTISHSSTHCPATSISATVRATAIDRTSSCITPVMSRRPKACDVMPLVPMRRKPNIQ